MARSPLARFLRRLGADFRAADRTGIPADELRDLRAERGRRLTRRQFVAGAGLALGAAACTRALFPGRPAGTSPRIAIVGGGIAGLCAGLTLRDAGVGGFTIYEASTVRAGGRMASSAGDRTTSCGDCHVAHGASAAPAFEDGQVVDLFGELVDSNHATIRGLAARFGLTLTDLVAGQPAGTEDTYHLLGERYSPARAYADFRALHPVLQADLRSLGGPVSWQASNVEGRALDEMSVREYIERRVPGGHATPFGRLLDVAFEIECGAETGDQSALNLVYMLGSSPPDAFSIFGESDERYHVRGGVQQLPDAIAAALGQGERIQLDHRLEALARNGDGAYTLSFSGRRPVVADVVLLAVPFSILRDVDYRRAGFDELKQVAIQQQGQGHSGKLQLQFERRRWNELGSNGNVFTDLGFQNTWDPTRGEPGRRGILAAYTGGRVTDALAQRHPVALPGDSGLRADCDGFLAQLDTIFPGARALWNGRAVGAIPHRNPLFKTAYSLRRRGQYHLFGGYERVRQGNVFFAGEHTSPDFSGFMEGAASEGIAAARAIRRIL